MSSLEIIFYYLKWSALGMKIVIVMVYNALRLSVENTYGVPNFKLNHLPQGQAHNNRRLSH